MELTAPGKLVAIVVTLLGSFGFIVANAAAGGHAETTPAWATITLVTGYLIGNGVGAKRGQPSVPVWSTTPPAIDPAALATALRAVVAQGGIPEVLNQLAATTPASSSATVTPDKGD